MLQEQQPVFVFEFSFQVLTTVQQFSGLSILTAYVVKIFNEVFNKETKHHHSNHSSEVMTVHVNILKQITLG